MITVTAPAVIVYISAYISLLWVTAVIICCVWLLIGHCRARLKTKDSPPSALSSQKEVPHV
jgi:beta-lactamase regulating signal transducer with metallopeptidase domain